MKNSAELNKSEYIREDEYFIRSYEVDLTTGLRFSSLNRYMQESAWKNAEQLGFGFSHLIKKNLAWVLTRLLISVDRLPGWNEMLTINTWPSGKDSVFAYRDFQFFNENNEELGRATSSWCVIDLKTRKPVLIQSAFENKLAECDIRMFSERPGKIDLIKKQSAVWETVVGYQDLDVNGHVTNSRYIDWMLESYDLAFLKKHKIIRLEVNFLAEALYKHEISVISEKLSDNKFRHSIVQMNDNLEICRLETTWK